MKDAKTFWDKTAPRYAKSPIKDVASYEKKLALTQAYFQPDWRVLEFGCGTGTTAITHAPHVQNILATDISGAMLAIAEAKARDAGIENVRFQRGALEDLRLAPASFNAVLGLNILHLLSNVEATIAQVYELLKPGGIFVSNTVLLDELPIYWRMLIPPLQAVGFAPPVSRLRKSSLVAMLIDAGFSIEYELQPRRKSLFVIAKKM